MSDILFIKTSSLGDVIHQMPAVMDARRWHPNAHFHWIVEEAFAPLVRLHPAVNEVIAVATRRWRKAPLSPATWGEVARFVRQLRKHEFEHIIDSQGLLLKSALIARIARGRRHGYDARSIREPAASPLYDVRHRVNSSLHAVARNRTLTGLALGYAPEGAAEFELRERPLQAGLASTRFFCMQLQGLIRNGPKHRGSRLPTPCKGATSPWCCPGVRRPNAFAGSESLPLRQARLCPSVSRWIWSRR